MAPLNNSLVGVLISLGGGYPSRFDILYLNGSYLNGSCLNGSYLNGSYLNGSYLKGSYLKGSYLNGSYLKGSCLKGSCLNGHPYRFANSFLLHIITRLSIA